MYYLILVLLFLLVLHDVHLTSLVEPLSCRVARVWVQDRVDLEFVGAVL